MKNASSYRITAMTCLYFAVICLFPFFCMWNWLLAITVAMLLLFSMIGAHVKPLPLRVLLSLVPFAPAAYAAFALQDYIMAAILAAPAVFCFITLVFLRESPPLYRCRHEFYILAGICTLLSIMLTVTWMNPSLKRWPSFVYIGCCLLFGVLELRAARAGQTDSVRWQAGNAGFFLIPVAASAVVGVGLMFGFDYLVNWLAQFFYDEGVEVAHGTPRPVQFDSILRHNVVNEGISTAVPDVLETNPPKWTDIRNHGFDWRWIAIAAILIIACAVLIYFLTRKNKKELTEQEELDLSLEREVSAFFINRKSEIPEDDFNRAKVRELYRRYMSHLRSCGVTILPSETTHEISDSAASVIEDDTSLRTVYRRSRYDRETPITDDDVKYAEECYLRLVSEKKNETP